MKNIKIGTRNSPLALWQARQVAKHLQNLNYTTEIVPILASGDKQLNQPLYAMGITGVFTRDLDIALLNKDIDIAVHSLKDVPTQMPDQLQLVAFLERDYPQDVLIRNSQAKDKSLAELKIATSSLRRRAFWCRVFPETQFTDIRGNVQTRLSKLEQGIADATLFSLAALKRLSINSDYEIIQDMIPAPSQGVVTVAGHKDNVALNEIVRRINHRDTETCITIEREFLRVLEGGCTAPIGAFARRKEEEIEFVGRLCSLDGTQCLELKESIPYPNKEVENWGKRWAEQLLNQGGKEIMDNLKR